MSRYRVQLVPQGAIPRPLEIGVRMTPKVAAAVVETEAEPEPGCTRVWSGWAITVDGETASGTPIGFQNATDDPVEIHVALLGELCPEECIEWDLRAVVDRDDVIEDDVTVTPDGCEAVDITLGHSDLERYASLVFALFATVNGEPFGEAVIFAVNACDIDCGDGMYLNGDDLAAWTAAVHDNVTLAYSWQFTALNQYANYYITGISIHLPAVTADLCGRDPADITWVITNNGAASDLKIEDQGYLADDGFGNPVWLFAIGYDDGAGEFSEDETRPFSGSQVYLQPQIDGQNICTPVTLVEFDTVP